MVCLVVHKDWILLSISDWFHSFLWPVCRGHIMLYQHCLHGPAKLILLQPETSCGKRQVNRAPFGEPEWFPGILFILTVHSCIAVSWWYWYFSSPLWYFCWVDQWGLSSPYPGRSMILLYWARCTMRSKNVKLNNTYGMLIYKKNSSWKFEPRPWTEHNGKLHLHSGIAFLQSTRWN